MGHVGLDQGISAGHAKLSWWVTKQTPHGKFLAKKRQSCPKAAKKCLCETATDPRGNFQVSGINSQSPLIARLGLLDGHGVTGKGAPILKHLWESIDHLRPNVGLGLACRVEWGESPERVTLT